MTYAARWAAARRQIARCRGGGWIEVAHSARLTRRQPDRSICHAHHLVQVRARSITGLGTEYRVSLFTLSQKNTNRFSSMNEAEKSALEGSHALPSGFRFAGATGGIK